MAFDSPALDPNDPNIYSNPDKVRLLDPREQLIASLNLAKTGQLVNGDQTRTLEYILKAAGYDIQVDGELSASEAAALQNFKEKLEDKTMINAMNSMVETLAETIPGEAGKFGTTGQDWTERLLGMFVKNNIEYLAPSEGIRQSLKASFMPD